MMNKFKSLLDSIRNKFSKTKRNDQDNQFENTDEFNNDEIDNTDELDSTRDIIPMQQQSSSDDEQSESSYTDTSLNSHRIDLNQKLTFKDKLDIYLNWVKSKFDRFRVSEFETLSKSQGEDALAANSYLVDQLPVRLPPQVRSPLVKLEKNIRKIEWSNVHNEILAPKHRSTIHKWSFSLCIILVASYSGEFIASFFTTSPNNMTYDEFALDINKDSMLVSSDVDLIKSTQLFKTQLKEDQQVTPQDIQSPIISEKVQSKCLEASDETKLPIKIVNTVVLQDSVKSIASVQVNSNDLLKEYRVGEKIDNMAEVTRIDRMSMIIKNLESGNCEKISSVNIDLSDSPITTLSPKKSAEFKKSLNKKSAIKNDGNTFTIKKTFLQDAMKDISSLLTQARGIPINNPDGTVSFKIVEIQPGSVYSSLGIQNNDVITQINGRKIQNLNEVMSLFSKIVTLDKLNLTVNRGGEALPLDYKFQ